MSDYIFKAKLLEPDLIRVLIYAHLSKLDNPSFTMVKDGTTQKLSNIEKVTVQFNTYAYDIRLDAPLELGHAYDIISANFGRTALDVTKATEFADFDEKFYYPEPLGFVYTTKATIFQLWAPLASQVEVVYELHAHEYRQMMRREEKGVFRAQIDKNLDGARYYFSIVNSGQIVSTTDPYAIASTENGHRSAVVNLARIKTPLYENKLPPFSNYNDAIIYEASVRDMTIDKTTTIRSKGTYRGLIEHRAKTRQGNKVGIDYLVSLGITHLQLMPIYDFATVDETNPHASYNWGYDPAQYLVPEGSLSTNPSDPYTRIKEVRSMVSAFHQAGIRVNMDVVFNHVYESSTSVFERVVPNFYFRRQEDGKLSNGSFCGNDLASERPMVRHLIIHAIKHWITFYGIDGYRFDLMGILDISTMKIIAEETRKLKAGFMLYGEGWNMPTALSNSERATMDNAHLLPGYAFFNDSFRDIVKGPTADDHLADKGYLSGAEEYRLGFKFAYVGSSLDLVFKPKFQFPHQSINYVECHDNSTLFDKLVIATPEDSERDILQRIKLINAINMLAFGVPFFHQGQEIGLSKFGDFNSYKSGDKVNQFAYVKLDDRLEMANYFYELTKLRKDCGFLREDQTNHIEDMIEFEDLPSGGLLIDYVKLPPQDAYKQFSVFINPSKENIFYELKNYAKIIFSSSGYVAGKLETFVRRVMIPPLSVIIVGLRHEDDFEL